MKARSIAERLVDWLSVRYVISDVDLARIPRTGPAILTLNHPFGILEGAVLAKLPGAASGRTSDSSPTAYSPRFPSCATWSFRWTRSPAAKRWPAMEPGCGGRWSTSKPAACSSFFRPARCRISAGAIAA